ncbi:MAG: ATP-binding protein [Mariprofundales bacterium]
MTSSDSLNTTAKTINNMENKNVLENRLNTSSNQQDTLLHLAQMHHEERNRHRIDKILLKGINILMHAHDDDSIFARFITILEPMLPFDAAMLFVPDIADSQDNEKKFLYCMAANNNNWEDQSLLFNDLIQRVLDGQCLRVFDMQQAALLPKSMHENMQTTSALLMPLSPKSTPGVLMLTMRGCGSFTTEHVYMLKQLIPLAVQALRAMELRQLRLSRALEQQQQKIQDKLSHAQKLESLGILAGRIAHDFNNLLTAIMGNASLVQTYSDQPDKVHDYIDRVIITSKRAADLCQQMLAYSGKAEACTSAINLSTMVTDMLRLLRVSISTSVQLHTHLDDTMAPILGDITQLRQLMMNLITNANESIAASGDITVEVKRCTINGTEKGWQTNAYSLSAGEYACLCVKDNGCGMDNSTLERMFEPFFSTKFTGHGLGMGATLGIARSHHAGIRICSAPQQGTSFAVYFPMQHGITSKTSLDMQSSNHNNIKQWRGSGTILLIDDEEEVRAVAGEMLKHLGFDVVYANDGIHAIEQAWSYRQKIVLAIIDIMMPHLGGIECFTEMRRFIPNLSALLSSGYNAEHESLNHPTGTGTGTGTGTVYGIKGFIQKPYELSILAEQLQQILDPVDE